ncbi:hypothetical protein [Archangium sp.]|jgi:hypothetical protein|uniref:hypothetical protein n=1 Tax=Archangium sp. TaxID=1872627 RepID=UPI002ED7BA76
MSASAPWEAFLREHFPGYLLPESARTALTPEEASLFLERLTGRPHELALLRAVSTLSPHIEALRDFSLRLLPELVRALPAHTEVSRREWEGGFQGRLDVQRTLQYRMAGQRTRFVTQTRRRSFALPENVLVRHVAERLLHLLVDLRQAGVLRTSGGWGQEAQEFEGRLRHLLASTVLREVPLEPVGPRHEQAAHASRHPAYRAALAWHGLLREGLDSRSPEAIARVVARGALSPLEAHTRFEIAVLVRLLQALWSRLERTERGRWSFQRHLVHRRRNDVASFERDDGARLRVFYNQAWLDPGPSDQGVRHYLGHPGRLRPDVTVVTEHGDFRSAAVLEVKLSERRDYLARGYQEAMLYRWEYAPHLKGWPKAILVTSSRISGELRVSDDVIAVGWEAWVPAQVVAGLLGGLSPGQPI